MRDALPRSWRQIGAALLIAQSAVATTFTGFGDSITYGISSSWGEGYITIYRYYNGWEMPSVDVENQGNPSETTSQGLARVASAINQTGATHLLLMEGTNDISQGASASSVISNLEAMAGIADGMGVVPVVGCPPPRKSSDSRDPGNQTAQAVSDGMRSFAQGSGYPFAEIFESFQSEVCPDCLLDDRVHPDDSGYVVMARAWHEGLRPIFGPPTLTSCSPDWGVSGTSTAITLTGASLGAGMQGYLFNMLDYNQPVRSLTGVFIGSSTTATATVPASVTYGMQDVVLAYPSGGGAVLHRGFSSTGAPPANLALAPNSVPAGQTTTIAVSATNLPYYGDIYFGTMAGTSYTWYSATQASVVNPPLPAGLYDVRIVGSDRAEATFPGAFYSLGPPPAIGSVAPPAADNWAAVPVSVSGSGFLPGSTLTFGTTLLSTTYVNGSRLDTVVPAGFPPGVHDVTVHNPDTQSATLPGGYTCDVPTPVVTAVAPPTVEAGARTPVTIDGDRFEVGASLTAGGAPLADVIRVSGQQLTAVVPQDLPVGAHDVTVTNPSGQAGTLAAGLTVQDTLGPTVAASFPEDGSTGAARGTRIVSWLWDQGAGVDAATVRLDVNAVPVSGVATAFGPRLLRVTYAPPSPLPAQQAVSVRVRASDLASPPRTLDRTLAFTVTDEIDGDGDALPSDWEAAHALDPASSTGVHGAAGDPDRDAGGNAIELGAGTDPTTAAFLIVAPGPGLSSPARAVPVLGTGQRFDAGITLPYSGYGLNVGASDVEADGTQDVLTGPGPSPVYGPQVRAFRSDLSSIGKVNFYAYGTLRYGVKVAGARLEGGARELLVTGPGPGAVFGPQIRAFRYDGAVLAALGKVSFFAYGTLKYGVTPGAGDLDADGFGEIVTGAASAPVFGPHVRAFNYDNAAVAAIAKVNFFAYATLKYGVNPSSADLDADGFDEIGTGPGSGANFGAQVRGFDVDGGTAAAIPGLSFLAFPSGGYGAKVGLGDLDGDRRADIAAGHGEGPALPARVRTFVWSGAVTPGFDVYVWDGTAYGANVVGARLGLTP